jgi:hypothetical protein
MFWHGKGFYRSMIAVLGEEESVKATPRSNFDSHVEYTGLWFMGFLNIVIVYALSTIVDNVWSAVLARSISVFKQHSEGWKFSYHKN